MDFFFDFFFVHLVFPVLLLLVKRYMKQVGADGKFVDSATPSPKGSPGHKDMQALVTDIGRSKEGGGDESLAKRTSLESEVIHGIYIVCVSMRVCEHASV